MAEYISNDPVASGDMQNHDEEEVYIFPTSFAQQRLWFLDQFEPNSPFYNIFSAIRIRGPLNEEVLNRCVQEVVRRHESLRTTFMVVDGEPVQVIHPSMNIELEKVDLQHLDKSRKETEVERLLTLEARKPFNLATGPLLRTRLLKLEPQDYIFMFTMHHIISDGWSLGIFVREITLLYDAFSRGAPSPLPELPIQYADYTLWQKEYLQGETLEKQLEYWKKQLGDSEHVLELPTDRPRPAVQTSNGASITRQLPRELSEAVREFSRRENVTVFITLLAAFQTLLYRYTGQEDISVGTPIANRTQVDTENLIGFFINTLVMRSRISGRRSFRELLRQVRETALGAYAHQDIPFEKLVEELRPERDMSHTPLFQVMFVLQNTPMQVETRIREITLSSLDVDTKTSTFDLTLMISESEHGYLASVEYNTDIFEEATIQRLLDHYQTLLENILKDPTQPVASIPLSPEQEIRKILQEWNQTRVEFPADRCIHQLVEEQVEKTPHAEAVVFGDRHLTYRELNRRANQLAHYLIKKGVGPETTVGISLQRSPEMIVGILGILKAGGAYLPLDPNYPQDRLNFMMADAEVQIILTQQELTERFQGISAEFVLLDRDWPSISREREDNPRTPVLPENLAYLIYTSGSTGIPKGVQVTHRSVVNHNQAMARLFSLKPDDRVLQFATINFDAAVEEIFPTLMSGGTLVLRNNDILLSIDDFIALIESQQITVLDLPTAYWHEWVAEIASGGRRVPDSVRLVILGGDKAAPERFQLWNRKVKKSLRLLNTYGPTETTIVSTSWEPDDATKDRKDLIDLPIGRPIDNTRVYVLDAYWQPVPIGVPGELFIGGEGVSRGYLKRPDLTAERFVPNPFDGNGERLYRTGDLVRFLPDGNLQFLGRVDYQVKIRGFRVEIGEIESVLNQHPALQEAVVVARKDPGGEKRLVAYCVPRQQEAAPGSDSAGLTSRELREYLGAKLPDYMVPAVFMFLDKLPKTPSGKIDRRALPEVTVEREELKSEYVAPRTPTEELLASLWSRLLGVERLGVLDNFFEVGGHSLLATQLVSRIRDTFQVDLPLRVVFEAPTIADLARRIEEARLEDQRLKAPPIVPVSRSENIPLSFAQQRLWFLDQLEPDSPFYNIPLVVRIEGDLDLEILEKSVNEIIHRHEILRTTFSAVNGQPVQVIHPELKIEIPLQDLQDVPTEKRQETVLRLANQEAQKPFNLSEGPLLRLKMFQLAPEDYVLVMTIHHIIADDWSTAIFIQEVAALYDAFSQGKPSPLPELPVQYADFAYWQRQWLQGEVLESQLDYWRKQLAGIPQLLELPTDRPRPPVQTFKGAFKSFQLSAELTRKISDLSQQEGATLFMTMLAIFNLLLYRYSGQEDICVGSPIANRSRAEVERLIGIFVNTLVFRTDLSGNPTFRELLERVREMALGAYAHQDVPFEMLVDELQPERDLSHSPLFQVAYTLLPGGKQGEGQQLQSLKLTPLDVHSGTAKFDLTLYLNVEDDHISGTFEYNTDLFDASTIERMIRHYEMLVRGIGENPDGRIGEFPLLTEEEQRQILLEWNATERDFPLDRCAHQLFEQQAEQRPDALAVTFRETEITYGELNRRANRLAWYLRKLGVEPETPVGLCVERSTDLVVGILGVLKAGGAYLPIDPTYPAERIAYMLEDAGVKALLTQRHLVAKMAVQDIPVICLDSDWETIAREPGHNPNVAVTPENLAYLIYTSGSTGLPKGVQIHHQGLLNLIFWHQEAFEVTAADRATQVAGPGFDASVWEVWPYLTSGASIHIPEEETRALPEALQHWLVEQGITISFLPTPLAEQVLLLPWPTRVNLKKMLTGGDRLSQYPSPRLPFRLINNYGPTESTVVTTSGMVPAREDADRLPTIGKPIANTRVYLLDRHGQPVPVGVPGEIHISSVGLSRGYLNRPEQTAESFVPNPFAEKPGERLYKTGDLARYLPDGSIDFLGRVDFQVKIRGFRIELGEIEAVLTQHPGVKEGVVLVREDVPGEKRLVAYVVGEEEQVPDLGNLREFLRDRLPDYMVPSAFVMLDALPLTPNGKVDRRALPAPDWSQVAEEQFVEPRTEVEKRLAEIWSEILGVERVGVNHNFFDLGGHSLLATQLVSRLREVFHTEISLRNIFEFPTIAALAPVIESKQLFPTERELPPVKPEPRDGKIPLSFAQQRLWFLDHLEPGSPSYNLPAAVRLSGPLNVEALERSINEIVRRHESLRTTFAMADGEPVQVIHPEMKIGLEKIDLRSLAPEEREKEAFRLATEDAKKPFDLTTGPLLRTTLLYLGPDDYVLLLAMHHIVSDGWSMGIFIREVAALYEAFSQGLPSPLPELPVQYADYAIWQRRYLQGEVLEKQFAYWEKQLGDSSHFLELPTDRPRPAIQTFRGHTIASLIPESLSEKLNRLSREEGVTLFITLMAAFKTLLYRYSGQEDISVGTPIANRTQVETENLIGFFVNTLVMRTRFSGKMSFKELLHLEREVAFGAYAHQDLPFEMLVERLQPERDLSHNPLFQVMFVFQNAPVGETRLPDLTIRPLEVESGTAKFDLTLSIEETPQGLSAAMEYNTDLFDQSTIERMLAHFRILLENLVVDPKLPLASIPIMSEAERRQLLVEWNNTAADDIPAVCIHHLLEKHAEQTPQAIALVHNDQQLTYSELNRRANQLAHYLRRKGIRRGEVVGICVERSVEMVVGLFGVLKAGAVHLPLDPAYPDERINYILEDANVSVVLTQKRLKKRFALKDSSLILLDAHWKAIAREGTENPQLGVGPEDLAYVIYTSGSTGQPKGTLLHHRGAVNFAVSHIRTLGLSPHDRVLQFASFSFDASLSEIFSAFAAGATLCLTEREILLSMPDLKRLFQEQKISMAILPPSLLRILPSGDLPDLRILISAGESCSKEILEKWSPGRQFYNGYGPTETTIGPTLFAARVVDVPGSSVPIGRPLANVQVYIVDANLQPVPVGVPGELCIAGLGLAYGYLGRPDLTAEKFIPNPFSENPGERLYRTGDKARYLPDGNIEFLGRIDQQVKIRGFRIELGEIVAVLEEHPAVHQAYVMAREDLPGNKRLVAYLVPEKGKTPGIRELTDFLKERLPEYMIPSAFVSLEALPLTPNGKIDWRALPVPEQARPELQEKYVAPRTPVEKKLALIWERVLGVDHVGIRDNFFELGGDSILSIQIISQANQEGLRLNVKQFFQNPTIEELARVAETAEVVVGEQEQITGPVPLTPIQHWFFEHFQRDPSRFNISSLLEISLKLDINLIRKTIWYLLKYHDALRTRFERQGDNWQQTIVGLSEIELPVFAIDLSHLSRGDQKRALHREIAALQASFDLSRPPLLRVAYFNLGNHQADRLFIACHHLVVDGVSWRILMEDIFNIYQKLSAGQPAVLPPKTTSLQKWANFLTRHAQSSELLKELDYWLKIGRKPVGRIPLDFTEGQNTFGSMEVVETRLEIAETRALLKELPKHGLQINEVLFAALAKTLARWTGEPNVLVETEGHGREYLKEDFDLSRTLGWFTSAYPVYLELPLDLPPEKELFSIKQQLKAIPNKGIGFGLLKYLHQDELVRESLKKLPQPEVNFNYLGQYGQISRKNMVTHLLKKNFMKIKPAAELDKKTEQNPANLRSSVLDVICSVAGRKLQIVWLYSRNLHSKETIEHLVANFKQVIRDYVEYFQKK